MRIEIREVWRFQGQEDRITYVVRGPGDTQRMLWEPVTTPWGQQLVALEAAKEAVVTL